MQIDDLRKLLDSISAQIKTFDTKAQIVMGINGIIAGQAVTQLARVAGIEHKPGHVQPFYWFFFLTGIAVASLAVSFWFALRTIRPHIEVTPPKTVLFFRDLAEQFGSNYQRAAQALMEVDDGDLARQLAGTIQVTALICDKKASRCQKAITATSIGVVFYVMSMAPSAIMSWRLHEQTQEPPKPAVSAPAVSSPAVAKH